MLRSPNCFKFVADTEFFSELTWNLSIRSKALWAKSFLQLLGYCKQIIQNQCKTARRAGTINVCWRKSSCELFPLTATHAKVANSGSGKMVIARYRILYFFKKSSDPANATGKLARYWPALCISLYCDACLKSNALSVGVKTLHNTI